MHPTTSDTTLQSALQRKIDNKTKPVGSLGMLEQIAMKIGLIQQTLEPELHRPQIVVFAGDHGIAATGLVNPYPQAVTAQMVLNFLRGGAAINVFCRQHGIGLTVVDTGVNHDFGDAVAPAFPPATTPASLQSVNPNGDRHPVLIDAKIGFGTANYLEGEAMSAAQLLQAIGEGRRIVQRLSEEGCNCIGFGEMGIGNTSSASLIMSFMTGIPIEECVGRGTGVNDQQLRTKAETLTRAYEFHRDKIAAVSDPATTSGRISSPLRVLQCVGGFEIAMMTGAYMQAAERRMLILVDGYIATAALLLARAIDPTVDGFCLFTHASGEQGHEKMLGWLGVRPILNLGMRLGEGTGAAMAYPIVQSAVRFLNEMASFESAGVSNKS